MCPKSRVWRRSLNSAEAGIHPGALRLTYGERLNFDSVNVKTQTRRTRPTSPKQQNRRTVLDMTQKIINDEALDIVFRDARTRNDWEERPVSETLIQAVYDLTKMGPTSANCSPARFVFVTSDAGKERLRPFLSEGNLAKTMAAPVCVIIGHDMNFIEKLPELFPHTDAASWFAGNEPLIEETAFRNGSLQGAYLMMAARALGLDCGPMSGFDKDGVDKEFFAGTTIKTNFLCNIGYGTDKNLFPRSPRLSFQDACQVI